jgi:hypothetical protein
VSGGIVRELRESSETVEEEPERAEPRRTTVSLRRAYRGPWWRRVFGGWAAPVEAGRGVRLNEVRER